LLPMLVHGVCYFYLCYSSVVTSPVTVQCALPFLLHSVVTSPMLLHSVVTYVSARCTLCYFSVVTLPMLLHSVVTYISARYMLLYMLL